MPLVDLQGRVAEDSWSIDEAADATPRAHVAVPLAALLAAAGRGEALGEGLGVILPPDAPAETVAKLLPHLALIAVSFPKFRDGRGFTLARALRYRYGFGGEIRAVGHVIPDQLEMLCGCGFTSVQTPAEHPPEQWAAVASLELKPGRPRQLLNRLVTRL